MSKRQKLSFFPLEGLPDEIILKILSLLDVEEVLLCGQVSKRLRAISNDQSLWLNLDLFLREVPYGIIEKAVKNGCEYMKLDFHSLRGGKKSEVPWKFSYLEICQSGNEWFESEEVPEGILQNCHSLQKLALNNVTLNSREIEHICQNGETLRILSLEGCNIDFNHRIELIQKLFDKCPQLTELNIREGVGMSIKSWTSMKMSMTKYLDPHVCALVDNLTPNILKLSLRYQKCVQDRHVISLVQRCNKIKELDLTSTSITSDSMESIIKHLNSLEKLDLGYTNIDFSSLLRLKSIPTLKILRCFGRSKQSELNILWSKDAEKIKNLKLQLPHISINEADCNEDYLHIACTGKKIDGTINEEPYWEIRAKQQDTPALDNLSCMKNVGAHWSCT